jgi:hypothetical protein
MVPPKCSLSKADYEPAVLLVRLDTTWVEASTKPHCLRSFCSPRGGHYRSPITNKILQLFAMDYNESGYFKDSRLSSMSVQCLRLLPRGGGAETLSNL